MSEAKHTPGPWTAEEHGGMFYVFGPDAGMVADNNDEDGFASETLARSRGTGAGRSEAEQRANASLIAAAPDLLEVCKDLALRIRNDEQSNGCNNPECGGQQALRRADAAIKKAEGR